MGKSRPAGWIAGTVVVILAIFAGTYFFLYQPRAEAVDETLALAEEARSRNDLLEIQVADLAAKAQDIDGYLAELDVLAAQMPPTAQLASLTATLRQGAEALGLTVVEIAPGAPTPVTVPTTQAATPAPTDTAAPADGTQATPAPADASGASPTESAAPVDGTAAPAPGTDGTGTASGPSAADVDGLVAIPVRIQVVGSYANAVAYLDHLQVREGRLLLIGDIEAARQRAQPPNQGLPQLFDGDLRITVNAYAYVLLDTLGAAPVVADLEDDGELNDSAAPVDDGSEAEPVMPTSPNNPFVPLTPTK